jgi:hypothetical protein
MKTSVLITTALIPSVLMGLSANFLQLSGEYQNLLESFTTGLLIVSGWTLSISNWNNIKIYNFILFFK